MSIILDVPVQFVPDTAAAHSVWCIAPHEDGDPDCWSSYTKTPVGMVSLIGCSGRIHLIVETKADLTPEQAAAFTPITDRPLTRYPSGSLGVEITDVAQDLTAVQARRLRTQLKTRLEKVTPVVGPDHPAWCAVKHTHATGVDGCWSRDVETPLGYAWLLEVDDARVRLVVDCNATDLTEAQVGAFVPVTDGPVTVANPVTADVTDAVRGLSRAEVRKVLRQLASRLAAATPAMSSAGGAR